MKGKSLGTARALFRARKFPEVIRVLEPEVFRYRENFDYFHLLGFACLHAGDLGGAFSYISRAHQLRDDDISVKLGLAAIHFRRAENDNALKRWLEVIEAEPSNRIARKGLDLLRRGLTPDSLQEIIDSGRLRQLFPPLPARLRGLTVLAVVLGVLAVGAAGYLAVRTIQPRATERPGVAVIDIPPDLGSLTDAGTEFKFVMSENDVRNEFRKAKNQLLAWRDNLAAVAINRILLSNAAAPVKERARMLKGFITPASFDTLRDGFSYAAVAAQPSLYDGCSVRWKGKIANLQVGKSVIAFDLLVGYDQEKELQGIVPVTLPFATDLDNGIALEVLGQVAAAGSTLSLTGVSVHRLASP
jgi:hypothetical protein